MNWWKPACSCIYVFGLIGVSLLLCPCAGFPLNDQLFQLMVRRYSDEQGNMDFDNYIGCLVRLDAMCRKWLILNDPLLSPIMFLISDYFLFITLQ